MLVGTIVVAVAIFCPGRHIGVVRESLNPAAFWRFGRRLNPAAFVVLAAAAAAIEGECWG